MDPTVPVMTIEGNATLLLALRPNEMLIWLRFRDFLSGSRDLGILDFWLCREDTSVTITNRAPDLPAWFQLHPTEASGILAYKMMEWLQAGHTPTPPVDAPNIWRVLAGDRLVHCGGPRGGEPARIDGLIGVYAFQENAAVIADSPGATFEDWITFGSPGRPEPTAAERRAGQSAVELIRRLGPPRKVSTRWTLSW